MPPTTYIEVLEKIKKVVTLILNCPFGRHNKKPIFEEEAMALLYEAAENSEGNRRKKNFGVIGGSATGIIGGALAITGAALVPVTFGASVGLMAAGTAVGVVGASVSIGFSLDKFFRDKGRRKLIQPTLESFVEFQKNLLTSMVYVKVALDEVALLRNGMTRLDQSMPRRIRTQLCLIEEDLDVLKEEVELKDTFDAYQLIKDLSYFAAQIIEMLGEISRFVEDTRSERKLKKVKQNPFNVLNDKYFELDIEEGTLAGGRTFYQFARSVYEVRPTNNGIDNSPLVGTAATAGITTAKGGATGGALGTKVAFQIADIGDDAAKAGAIALRVVRGVSVASIVLGAIGIVVDIGFLGHAIYDLNSGEPEKLAEALKDVAKDMDNINKLKVF